MGSSTKFSASEAAEAMNYMAMAGWKTEDMLSGIEGVMNLAAASGEDLATTSDIVTDALTAFVPKVAGVIKTVQTAFAALDVTMLANPIVLIIAAITALVAAFIYLWNTNEEFRQFWIKLWEDIKKIAITVWEGLKTFLTSAWEGIKATAETVWNGIRTVITTVLNGILNTITTVWNNIRNTVSTVLNTLKNVISTAFNAIWNGIKSTVSGIYNIIKTGFDNAVNFIKSLASSAFKWGADIINGIVNSIRSCIGKVKDAVTSVANTIKPYLHFSVPDEGPLTDYESWMPDFMKGLAKGIEKSKWLVKDAVSGLAADMVINPQVNANQVAMTGGGSVSSADLSSLVSAIRESVVGINGNNGDIVIPVYLGVRCWMRL